jgi:hypothetical protein
MRASVAHSSLKTTPTPRQGLSPSLRPAEPQTIPPALSGACAGQSDGLRDKVGHVVVATRRTGVVAGVVVGGEAGPRHGWR